MKRLVGTTRSPLVSLGSSLESILTTARPWGPEGPCGVFSGTRQSCGSDSALVPGVEASLVNVGCWLELCPLPCRQLSSPSPPAGSALLYSLLTLLPVLQGPEPRLSWWESTLEVGSWSTPAQAQTFLYGRGGGPFQSATRPLPPLPGLGVGQGAQRRTLQGPGAGKCSPSLCWSG